VTDEFITNVLLSFCAGALAIGVTLLIGMAKKLNRVELKVERLIARDEHRQEEVAEVKEYFHIIKSKLLI
jgi:hypothetical protein